MQQLRTTTDGDLNRTCAREVLDAVPPVVWFLRREFRAFRKGLSLTQVRALSLIQRQPAANLSVVAEFLGVSLPTASRIVQGLVSAGLLVRQGSRSDRRQMALAISPAGDALLQTAYDGTQARLREQLQGLSADQQKALAQAMGVLKEIFGAVGLSVPRKAARAEELQPA
jgi:DNA-binding MarR family transcriptional regulator